ncbi:D-alanyl-D-alanine carboxypeptidase/D-alanyl-D-alanine-endopeptidase [Pseudoduganella armeniaca]|uniref:D-alanyl-D-alanine carboxypeptidase n=1 Tax=Pseudoduganella armeniaca TaxID=2072590 RepID=A0A2R4C4F2_9BURK|nr:D-alanyl-D-alanine carboxypeptidase [Pseudoduganella armeniaca]AVR94464.1 D-alanyl-D-alanine carboxypeptidase [Pseudoduganella armeniaca]
MSLRRILCAALLACAGSSLAALPEPVAKLALAAGIPEDAIGAVVLRGDTILVSNAADTPMNPASTMKVVTTLVGLEQLGPAFRGRTELRSNGSIVGNVLRGDLILRGGADMDLNADALTHLLERLRSLGVRKIAGDLVLDRQLFQPARPDAGAPPFDEAPEAYYNVIPDALLLNMNMLYVELAADGRTLTASMLPELDKVDVKPALALVDGDCAKWDAGWRLPTVERHGARLTVVLHGTFPRHCRKNVGINVLDRDDYADRLVRATWQRLGGTIGGKTRTVDLATVTSTLAASAVAQGTLGSDTPASATPVDQTTLLAEHVSRALPELVRDTLKTSDNALARTLFLSLGSLQPDPLLGSRPLPAGERLAMLMAAHGDDKAVPATTAARAEQAIRQWLKEQHIDDDGVVFENGSGLSRTERIRPVQLAAVLRAGQTSPWLPEFQASLPIAAIDGTMRKRLKDSPAAGRARIKTGTLSGVVAVAGYVPDANGEECIVVAIVNHERAGNGVGRGIVDALIDWTANSSAGSAM